MLINVLILKQVIVNGEKNKFIITELSVIFFGGIMVSIAIDGPAGSGKSSLAKLLADELDIEYIDTGAMYRAVALKAMKLNITSKNELEEMLKNTTIDFSKGRVYLDDEDVSEMIRTESISKEASKISKLDFVRSKLVDIQKSLALKKSVVMEGRDIGTVVLKNANYKFFITASVDSRAKRRYEQLLEKNLNADFDTVKEEIKKRDFNDENRKNSPLKVASDAIVIDNSDMTLKETFDLIVGIIRGN